MNVRKRLISLLLLFLTYFCCAVTQEIVNLDDGTMVVITFNNNGKMKWAEEHKPNGDLIIVNCNKDGQIITKEVFRADGFRAFIEFETNGQMRTKEEYRTDGTTLTSYYFSNDELVKDVESLLDGSKVVNFYFANEKYQTKIYKSDHSLQIIYYDEEGDITTIQNYDMLRRLISEETRK